MSAIRPARAPGPRPSIGITLGDPGGIGPEVTAKALSQNPLRGIADFVIIGSRDVYRRYSGRVPPSGIFLDVPHPGPVTIGRSNPVHARASLNYLLKAVDLLRRGAIQALVTAPVCKEAISRLGRNFRGHTEFLAERFHVKHYEMMFVQGRHRTVIMTRHIPLSRVSREITAPKIVDVLRLTDRGLRKYFGITRPRLAVCGLNPHAGEGGKIGKEEINKIIPAVLKARRQKILAEGPFPADTLFRPESWARYDAIIAMYHDQGLVGIKSIAFNKVVNLTIGLPFIRTSPSHGTAFDIAGKNKADPGSMTEALRLAAVLSRR